MNASLYVRVRKLLEFLINKLNLLINSQKITQFKSNLLYFGIVNKYL